MSKSARFFANVRNLVLGPKPNDANIIYHRSTAPQEKRTGKGAVKFGRGNLWIDTSSNPQQVYGWDGKTWVLIRGNGSTHFFY